MEKWFTALEIEALALDGLPSSRRRIAAKAARENWLSRSREGRGGGREYSVSALPKPARDALVRREAARSENLPVPVETTTLADPRFAKDWQVSALEGRAILLAEIKRLQAEYSVTQAVAIETLVAMAQKETLPDWLADAAEKANIRRRSGASALSRGTLFRWAKEAAEKGSVNALIPQDVREQQDPAWVSHFNRLWLLPTKPSIAACHEKLPSILPENISLPTYEQLRGYLRKLTFFQKNKGRIGPKEIRSHKAFVARDISDLQPGWIYVGDGHTFKAQIAHPVSGRPFRPEITTLIDVATRKVVGFSVALSENTLSVADALRDASKLSVPAIFYYDNGSGANNRQWDDPAVGMIARLGITKKNSIPGNSQARGVIEHLHSAVLHKAAKWLPTYVGKDMDPDARFLQDRRLRKDIKDYGASAVLPKWRDFIDFLTDVFGVYNDRPHSSLPKIRDSETGRTRHQSPNERWAEFVADGADLYPLSPEERDGLFRPVIERICRRALVQIGGDDYYNRALEPYEGQTVRVAIDIHDGTRVLVSDDQGRLICQALFDGHKQPYYPQNVILSAVEKRNEKRVDGQVKRLEDRIAAAETGRAPRQIDHQPVEPIQIAAEFQEEALVELEQFAAARQSQNVTPLPGARPRFADDGSYAQWIADHPAEITDRDRNYFRAQLRDQTFLLELRSYGVVAEIFEDLIKKRGIA